MFVVVSLPGVADATSYNYPCDTEVVHQLFIGRGSSFIGGVGTDYRGAIGDAYVRDIIPCSAPTTQIYDDPAVLPANLQTDNLSQIVQIGYLECRKVAGSSCNDIPSDGKQHFFYICSDSSGGVPCLADGWAGAPVVDRRYRFRVEWQSSTNRWIYSIKDLVLGTTKTKAIASTWHNASGAWWGIETRDPGSTRGPQAGVGRIQMYWMQYLRASVTGWQVTTGNASTLYGAGGPTQPWEKFQIYNQNYSQDAINIWTELH